MLDFLIAKKEIITVFVALIAAVVSVVSIGLNFLVNARLHKLKTLSDLNFQKLINEQSRKSTLEDTALRCQKDILVSLQTFRTFVLTTLKSLSKNGIEQDEIVETLERLSEQVSVNHAAIYANCTKVDELPAHIAKTICWRISSTAKEQLKNNKVEIADILKMLDDLKEAQDTIRDKVLSY